VLFYVATIANGNDIKEEDERKMNIIKKEIF